MSHYEKLKISSFIGQSVIIGFTDGTYKIGLLDIDLVNEDWHENDEREALVLEIDGHLVEFPMDTIKFIVKESGVISAEDVLFYDESDCMYQKEDESEAEYKVRMALLREKLEVRMSDEEKRLAEKTLNGFSWNEVCNTLYDGTVEEIKGAKCPNCGGSLHYEYYPKTTNTEISCTSCNTTTRGHGAHYVPNFAKIGKGWFARLQMEILWHIAKYKRNRRLRS